MAAAILPIIAIVGTAVSAVGAISQGTSAANAANYNAKIQQNNALTAARVAAAKEEAQRRQANLALGEQSAALAQAGIGLGGSAADVQRQSRINAALDALNIRYEGQIQSQNYRADAELLKYQGGQDLTAAGLGAGTAILSGAANYGLANVNAGKNPWGF